MRPGLKPGVATLSKLRRRYYAIWFREWPHDNQELANLWLESRTDHQSWGQTPTAEVWETALMLMRECHEFDNRPEDPQT